MSFTNHPMIATTTPTRAQATESGWALGYIVMPNDPTQTPTKATFIPFIKHHPLLDHIEIKTGDDPLGASCKESLCMTSYGGIIRIRL